MLARRAPDFLLPFVLTVAAAVIAGCEPSENAVLIDARTQGDVESIQVTVIDRSGARTPSRSSPRPIRRSARDVNSGEPIRVAVPLPGPMDVIVHIVATGRDPDDRFVATRCYGVRGLVRDEVLLVGPIGTDIDADSDGFPLDPVGACRDLGEDGAAMPCDFVCPRSAGGDCDDGDPTIHPGARELCRDGVDQDCDGEDAPCGDHDGDGWNRCTAEDPPGTCDCEDAIASVNPGAEEVCRDGVDQDCDGRDGLCDQDGDGFVADREVGGSPDCDDTNPDVHPGAVEVCTARDDPDAVALDEDCNGFVDDAADCTGDDLDRDGSPACTDLAATPCPRTDCDCNDCDPAIRPGATEVCGNGIDEDQRGGDAPCPAVDADGDGFAPFSAGGSDCNDADPASYPGTPERCGDRIEQSCIEDVDCTGDTDMDGFVPPTDCGPDDPAQTPGAVETCNQLDDDCDGVTNEVLAAPNGAYPQGTSGCVLGDARLGADCAGSNACITDFTSSVFHCGGCRVSCNVPGGLVVADQCLDGVCDCGSDSSTTAACAGGTSCCAGSGCRDLQTDTQNCGFCGLICDANADACAGGSCTCTAEGRACDPASAADTCCASGCVDLDSDVLNCGACGRECGARTTCGPTGCACIPGWGDCNGDMGLSGGDGCETDLLNTAAHCGMCHNGCSLTGAEAVCVDGQCAIGTCGTLREDCDGLDPNGCEVSLQTLSDCGACGVSCTRTNATPTCAGGVCATQACLAGFGSCDGNEANGCENTLDSLSHCGACGATCARANATATCAGDNCRIASCVPGFGNCDGNDPNGCEDTLDGLLHCGACGTPCTRPQGATSCAGDVCTLVGCAAGFGNCDGIDSNGCENTLDSLANCGACGTTCTTPNATPTCAGDVCRVGTCAAGFGDCDGVASNGCENTLDSLASCGACGAACTVANGTPTCAGDTCAIVSCNGGYDDCNGIASDGCERRLNTLTHCGGCGVPCALPHATTSCTTGVCQLVACDAGWADCDTSPANGCETPVDTASQCGACGVSCGAGESCTGGRCVCGGAQGGVGGGPVCDGALVDTCSGGTCTCGMATCDPDKADNCSAGSCRCGGGAACGMSRTCVSGACVV